LVVRIISYISNWSFPDNRETKFRGVTYLIALVCPVSGTACHQKIYSINFVGTFFELVFDGRIDYGICKFMCMTSL
jgi:hypothetical protein